MQGEFPAAYPQAAALHNIAVYPFGGEDGDNFTSALTGELQSASLSGKQLFNVATPESAAISGVRGNGYGGYVQIGRELGVDAVYFGDVTSARIDEARSYEQRTVCVQPNGFKCRQWGKETVECSTITAGYQVAPKAVKIATATLVYSNTVNATGSYKFCDGQVQPKTPEQLLGEVRASAALQVRRQVAPFNATLKVSLKKSASGLAGDQAQTFKSAVAFAEAGRMDRACALWDQLAPNGTSSSVDVVYDLGVCAEVVADWPRAVMLYTKADSMLLKPDAQVGAALQRSKSMQSNARQVVDQAR